MNHFSNEQDNNCFYNNADSFSMAFDDTWKSCSKEIDKVSSTKDEKVNIILSKIKEHPYLKEFPDKAKEIAYFRIRLLNLN